MVAEQHRRDQARMPRQQSRVFGRAAATQEAVGVEDETVAGGEGEFHLFVGGFTSEAEGDTGGPNPFHLTVGREKQAGVVAGGAKSHFPALGVVKSVDNKNGTSLVSQPAVNGKQPVGLPKAASDDERKEWQRTVKKLTQQAEESETKIGHLEERKKRLETELADPVTYGDDKLMQAKNDEYRRVISQINQLQDEWETVMLEAEGWEKKINV